MSILKIFPRDFNVKTEFGGIDQPGILNFLKASESPGGCLIQGSRLENQ